MAKSLSKTVFATKDGLMVQQDIIDIDDKEATIKIIADRNTVTDNEIKFAGRCIYSKIRKKFD